MFATPNRRNDLLAAALRFVRTAARVPGVCSISLLGSVTTSKPAPQDIDLLVVTTDQMDLKQLATAARRLQGQTQSCNLGADVFLAGESGRYIGRICHWRDCRPGIRSRCEALQCGHRPFLCDDLQIVSLSDRLIAEPPLTVWPQVVRRSALPPDVEAALQTFDPRVSVKRGKGQKL